MVGVVAGWSTTLGLIAASRVVWAESPDVDPDPPGVVLRVGVARSAGTVFQVAADGAAGLCVAAGNAVHCPARGPVTFRWGGDQAYVLVDGDREGPITLDPGESRDAWVLPPDTSRAAAIARLDPAVVRPLDVVDLFVRTGDHPIELASFGMLTALGDLASHPDRLVRRELPEALLPWWRHTASDPMPAGSPPIVPIELLRVLAADPDPVVRRRLAAKLRDLREPGEELGREATIALLDLAGSGGSVQRAALGSLAARTREGATPARETWDLAMEQLPDPGAPGRAAASTLASLAGRVSPGDGVDPREAVSRCLAAHPEKTWQLWTAWRAAVPFEPGMSERLVRGTLGVSGALLKSWGKDDPDGVADLFERWEAGPPHSDRWSTMARSFAKSEHPRLKGLAAAADNLSPSPAVTPTP